MRKNGERFSARKHSAVAAVLLALTATQGLCSVDNPDPKTFGGNAYHDGGWISYGTDINQENGYLQFNSADDYVYSPRYAAPIRKIMMETRCSSSSYPTRFLTAMPYVQGVEAPSLAVTNAVFDGKDKLTVVSFDFSASAGVDAFRLGMTGGTGNWGITRLAVFHGEKTDDEDALLREFAQQLPVPENLTLTGLASSSLSLSAFPVADAVGYCFELTRLTGCPRTEVREDFVDAPKLSSGWDCDAMTEGLTLSDGDKNYPDSSAGDEHALKVVKETNPKEGPVELGLVSPLSPEPISEWSFVGRFGALDKSNYFIVYGRTDASAEWTELATGLTPDKQQSNKLFSGTVDTALNIHQIRFVLAANADSWTTTGLDSLCVVYGGNEARELVSAQTNATPAAAWQDLAAGRYGYRVKALGATEGERQFKDSVWSEEQTVDLAWADISLSPPEDLAFETAGDELKLSWTPVAMADRYEVRVAPADAPDTPVATLVVKGASASVRISELGDYVVTVTAVSPGGVSTATATLENCTVALGKVTELAVKATAADTIAATWKEVPLAESYQAKLFKLTGTAMTEVASVATKECTATFSGLDKTAKYVVVVTPQPSEGGELEASSEVVDLAKEYFRPTGPVSLRSCRWLYQEDFSSLSNVTKESDLTKVPLAHWQFFKGSGEAETIFYTSGTNSTRGGVYCYSDAERSPDSFMIGTVASSTIGSSLGIAFVNDTDAVAVVANLTFRPVQRNVKAKPATYALEYLVTDGTWSIGTESEAWHPLAIPDTAPRTADDPDASNGVGSASVTVSLADGDQPLRLHQGQVVIFRWRHEKMSSGPMMGIDDVRVEFRNANGFSMIIR